VENKTKMEEVKKRTEGKSHRARKARIAEIKVRKKKL